MSGNLSQLEVGHETHPPLRAAESPVTPSPSYWSQVAKRLFRNKTAMAGALILLIFTIGCVCAPIIAPYPIDQMNFKDRMMGPGAKHLLGTDDFGRDIFSRLLYGGRISLLTGLITVTVASAIGVTLGVIAGYYRRLEIYIMQVMDILLALPALLLAIAIIAVLGPGLTNAMIAIVIAVIPSYVRIVRASVLSIREKEYIEAVRALGIKDRVILAKHILPNILSPIIVLMTVQFGGSILAAAALSFLGLGAQPPIPEWGAMVYVGKAFLGQAWWMSIFPGLAIMLVVLGFNLLGDGLRDALDPK
ncbi:ABC transporter permease [Brevibacillus centrosporus]|uniref:Peptide/nickel transport system permease protein n=1 Tax=Brevibacillus centrosporus TaxID=54910 RepID=A0A1I3SEX5_9BACL|nr:MULTISPECIES: ABC transporter permease [Brevibacillus]MEC2132283.1 ABC transporter permease [Brevibacillus centrosporus]MED1792788.1 ABC transporter permease [Brevibacillus nitrificans]MED4909434.1 ABC transporter permease [Brevibacillus centrosporus]SFJ57363.1 peptide/nickel transport system permease protein [Brevibacillus centrosporus]GED33145.1 peptide ABC transporter permease [Brevibacillus centrosporus]